MPSQADTIKIQSPWRRRGPDRLTTATGRLELGLAIFSAGAEERQAHSCNDCKCAWFRHLNLTKHCPTSGLLSAVVISPDVEVAAVNAAAVVTIDFRFYFGANVV